MDKRLMELSDDKKELFITVDETLRTNGVEKLIGDLLVLRAHMLPAVPNDPPHPHDEGVETLNLSVQNDPSTAVKLLRDGRIRFWIRHGGLGWMIYNLSVRAACGIRDYLVANTPDEYPGADFLTQEIDEGDKPH